MTIMQRLAALFSSLRARKGKKALGKAVAVSVLNQAVSSGTNFVLGIFLLRMLQPADFGMYGIGFAISLFYAGIGNALFLTQMVVHTPDKAPEERAQYAARIFLLVMAFCLFTAAIFPVLVLLGSELWDGGARYAPFAIAVVAASIAYLAKDFFVRHAYNVQREAWALIIHSVIAVVMACLLAVQYGLATPFDAERALWMYAAANGCGVFVGHFLASLPLSGHLRADLYADMREVWIGGKWATLTNLVYSARTQAHTIVVASMLGPVGVAKLNAARLLVTPVVMLTPALAQLALPRLAAARGQDTSQLMRAGMRVTSVLLALVVLYSLPLLAGYNLIATSILGAQYEGLFMLTALWCLWAVFSSVHSGISLVCQVLKQFKYISFANTASAIIALGLTYFLTIKFDLSGALVGVVVSEIFIVVVLSRIVVMSSKRM